MENSKTQCQKIIDYLKLKGEGTTLDFTRKLYIMSPRRRISEIRKRAGITGLTIVSERVKKNSVYFNIYRLARCKKTKPDKMSMKKQ